MLTLTPPLASPASPRRPIPAPLADAPPSLSLTLDAALTIGPAIPPAVRQALVEHLTLPNPGYVEAARHGRSTVGLPEILRYCQRQADGALIVPAGCMRQVLDLCTAHSVPVHLDDHTHLAPPVAFEEHIRLSDAQEQAVTRALKRRYGVIEAPPGAGKTMMGLACIARRRQPTLWLTHTRELVRQTMARAHMVLGLAEHEVGVVGEGQCRIGDQLTIALVQSLVRSIPPTLLGVGHLVVDEAHHVPAEQMAAVVARFPARYRLGLTATPYRRDGLDAVIGFYLGPIAARIDKAALGDRLIVPRIVKRETGIRPRGESFTAMVTALTTNPSRNRLMVGDVAQAVAQGRRCLVLSDRVEHVEALATLLAAEGMAAEALHGQQGMRQRTNVLARLHAGNASVVVATCSLVGEGFDCPCLDALFLTTPISYAGRVRQYVGRVSRSAPGKRDAIVLDYCDDHAMCWAAWSKRASVYRTECLRITAHGGVA